MTDWAALLDAMDEGLAASPLVLLDALPADPSPIPPILVGRAVRTLDRMAQVQATLEHDQGEIARELNAVTALQAAAPQTPSSVPQFLDTKA